MPLVVGFTTTCTHYEGPAMKASYRFLPILILAAAGLIAAADVWTTVRMWRADQGIGLLNTIGPSGAALLFAAVGAVIVLKRGSHAVGWAAIATGFFMQAFQFADHFATWSLSNDPVGPFGVATQFTAGARQGVWLLALWSLASLALLYPSGAFPSPRWRFPYFVVTGAVSLLVALGFVLPVPLEAPLDQYETFWGIAALEPLADYVVAVGLVSFLIVTLVVAANMLFRAWRSTGDEREQFKWFATSVALFMGAQLFVGEINDTVSRIADIATGIAILAIPVSIGFAILRYRLYDIDILIGKTLVYAPLTAVLAGTYSAAVLLFRFLAVGVTGKSSEETIVLTTLLVAAMFLPVKNFLQSWVDRLFKEDEKKRLDAYLKEVKRAADMLETETVLSRFAQDAFDLIGQPVRIVVDQPFGVIEHPVGAAHSPDPIVVPLVEGKYRLGQIEVSKPPAGAIRPSHLESIYSASLQLARIARLTGSKRVLQEP